MSGSKEKQLCEAAAKGDCAALSSLIDDGVDVAYQVI
jgi:hypothetical protein